MSQPSSVSATRAELMARMAIVQAQKAQVEAAEASRKQQEAQTLRRAQQEAAMRAMAQDPPKEKKEKEKERKEAEKAAGKEKEKKKDQAKEAKGKGKACEACAAKGRPCVPRPGADGRPMACEACAKGKKACSFAPKRGRAEEDPASPRGGEARKKMRELTEDVSAVGDPSPSEHAVAPATDVGTPSPASALEFLIESVTTTLASLAEIQHAQAATQRDVGRSVVRELQRIGDSCALTQEAVADFTQAYMDGGLKPPSIIHRDTRSAGVGREEDGPEEMGEVPDPDDGPPPPTAS
ncbi:hypothetical protein HYDPIDRAFT_167723 [Hydnomerulius pinastri MD-312]|uniref:Zn(2)-C6 fungal-type domain-containing protein n=1 Tax=Hydnomerulius pinastri MD-312 TaxID=994086 RepID=A0A0C9WFN1_9AGAM|nr:hypothetical protein HYDPIDRAFT_167723 [Hydnomerulius pinastri MD-312]